MTGEERLLVVGPAWVGDMVMAHSLFQTLRARHPATPIDVLAPPFTLPLLEAMPEVARGIPLAIPHGALGLGARRRVAAQLRGEGYTRALVLPRSFKSALVPWLARIPVRTGYLGELRWGLLTHPRPLDKGRLPRTVDRFVALGLPPGDPLPDPFPLPRLEVDPTPLPPLLARLGLPPRGDRRILALCPGAEYGPAKQWPLPHWSALAGAWVNGGGSAWVVGSPKEAAAGEEIARAAGGECHNLAGRTTLQEALLLLAAAHRVVTNDSGLMHVAAALDRPTVAIYGSSDPHHTPPLNPATRVLHLGLPCAPCFKRHCPEGHLRCLWGITPERVLETLRQVPPP